MSRKTDILDFIREFSHEKGYSPTIREIGTGIGLSPSSVYYYIRQLKQEHTIITENKKSRTLHLATQ